MPEALYHRGALRTIRYYRVAKSSNRVKLGFTVWRGRNRGRPPLQEPPPDAAASILLRAGELFVQPDERLCLPPVGCAPSTFSGSISCQSMRSAASSAASAMQDFRRGSVAMIRRVGRWTRE